MTLLPDNRIRYPAPRIDFETEVGETGQSHDTYPASGVQLRYDHMRMALIGLLASQSSHYEPTQYREGTLWFDLDTSTLKIRHEGAWRQLADVIKLDSGSTLTDWMAGVDAALSSSAPSATFSGTASQNTVLINVPANLQALAGLPNIRAMVYIGGSLQDPRDNQIINGATIKLINGAALASGDRFTVVLSNIPSSYFNTSNA